MKNADMPAMPCYRPDAFPGLTKREHFAAMVMQGFCAAPDTSDWSFEDLAEAAVGLTDALLAELERTS